MKTVVNTKKGTVAQCILTVVSVLFAMANLFSFSGVLFIIAAILAAPIDKIRNSLNKKLSNKVIIVLSVIFLCLGFLFSPATESETENDDDVETNQNDYSETDKNTNNSLNNNKNDGDNGSNNNNNGINNGNNNIDNDDTADNNDNVDTGNSGNNNSSEENKGNPNGSNTQTKQKYILNTKSKKIHYPSCWMVKKILEENKREYTGDEDDLFDDGYTVCQNCH